MKRPLQSVALALVLALLCAPAAAWARCAAMQPADHCPAAALHCPDCPEPDGAANLEQQPVPMDGPCCQTSAQRPAPRTDLQGPTTSAAMLPVVTSETAASPALPTPPPSRREAVFLPPAASLQAVLCTFLV